MKKQFVADFKVNEQIDSVFIVRKKNLKLTKYDKHYLELSLQDKTGMIEGRLWDNAEKFNEAVETGDAARVKGVVDKYREDKQLKVDFISKADDRSFRYEDMVRVAEDREKIYGDILSLLESMKNPWLLSLSKKIVSDEELMEAFKDVPGGKAWHNAYIGGLMEHTYEVMYISDEVCGLYPQANRDIAILGAFIHDIGKVFELDPKKMEYTVKGGLVGHIAIGYRILIDKVNTIPDFPEELSMRLEHIILSHHGKYEQQSPVLPKTLEATIIYQTDELVSQANAIKEIQLAQSAEGRVWSNYVSIKSRKYYIKDIQEEGWDPKEAVAGDADPGDEDDARPQSADDLFG